MPFEPAAEPTVGQQLLVGDPAGGFEQRVVQRRRMALGEHQMVVAWVVRVPQVHREVPVEQHGHQVGGRHRRGRVPGPGGRAGPDRVHPKLLGQFMTERRAWHHRLPLSDCDCSGGVPGSRSSTPVGAQVDHLERLPGCALRQWGRATHRRDARLRPLARRGAVTRGGGHALADRPGGGWSPGDREHRVGRRPVSGRGSRA